MTDEEDPRNPMPRWVPLLVLLLLPCVALFAYLGNLSHTTHQHDAAFEATARGMSQPEVLALLPATYETADSPVAPHLYWDDSRLDSIDAVPQPTVVRYTLETWYLPITWEYVFDQQGKLVGRHRYD